MALIKNIFAWSALLLATPLSAEELPEQQFGAFLEEFRRETGTPSLSAVIVKDGAIAWERYFGTSDDEADIRTTADTTYYIASVTKPIAATGIIAESFAGGIDLATPMAADAKWAELCAYFLTTPIPYMSGGEDRFGNPVAPVDCTAPTTIRQMLDMRANGPDFVYNPIAFARLDRVIEGAGGKPLREIVRERVLQPANMDDVGLGWRDPEAGDALRLLAMPHHVIDGKIVKQPYPDDDFRAAAGIIANPRALAAFDIAFDEGRIVPLAHRDWLVQGLETGALGDYRAGWWLEDYKGRRLLWHSGKDEKLYSAVYLKVPQEGLTLIVLANTEAIWNEGSSLVKAKVDQSPVARRFLELFVN